MWEGQCQLSFWRCWCRDWDFLVCIPCTLLVGRSGPEVRGGDRCDGMAPGFNEFFFFLFLKPGALDMLGWRGWGVWERRDAQVVLFSIAVDSICMSSISKPYSVGRKVRSVTDVCVLFIFRSRMYNTVALQ